jgi:hypothetical protein
MKIRCFIISTLLLYQLSVQAQSADTTGHASKRTETIYLAAAGPLLAVGSFSNTHLPGFTMEGGGLTLFRKRTSSPRTHPLLLNWSIAGDYFIGKKETVAGYSYTYPAYWLVHAYIGGAISIRNNIMISLSAGPGIGHYNGNTVYNTGVHAAVYYSFSKRFMLSPSFKLMQEPGTDWLGAVGLKVVMKAGR